VHDGVVPKLMARETPIVVANVLNIPKADRSAGETLR
jgi:hypothetical protein